MLAWATDGFRSLASWRDKELEPFGWGIVIQSVVVMGLLAIPRMAGVVADRRPVEQFGRGVVAGLKVAMLWAGLYLLRWLFVLFEFGYDVGPFLCGSGILLAAVLAWWSLVSDEFLAQNLLAFGSLTVLVGNWPLTSGREVLGCILVASGSALMLTVMLVTGRATLYHGNDRSGQNDIGHSYEVSRDRHPIAFWSAVVSLAGLILAMVAVFLQEMLKAQR